MIIRKAGLWRDLSAGKTIASALEYRKVRA